jgi:hypothetical protein
MWLTLHLLKEDKSTTLCDVNVDSIRTVLPAPGGPAEGIYLSYQNGGLDHFSESFPRWQELVRGAR